MNFDGVVAAQRARSEWIAPLLLVLLAPLLFLLPITHDAIWQMWIGRELLGGAKLYSGIIEVNPPLWFWMAVPLAAIGEAFGFGGRPLIIGFFLVSIGLSLFLSPARYRLPLLVACVLLPLPDFGQREHFTLISVAPYVFLIGARAEGDEVRHPWMIGLFAAFGLALKPYFVIVPAVLELLIWSKPRLRPETVALLACAVLYSAAVLIFAPEYLSVVVPMARLAYPAFQGQSNFVILAGAFLLAAVGVALRRGRGSETTQALGLAAVAFIPAVIIQGKGWDYHSIPARGFLFLAVVDLLRSRERPIIDAFLAAAAFFSLLPLGVYRNGFRVEAEAHLAGLPPGASVMLIGSSPMMAWPMVDEHGLNWAMQQFSLWQIGAILDGAEGLEQPVRRMVAQDLAKEPNILIVDRRGKIGPLAKALLPPGYLDRCKLRLRTSRMESYLCNPRIGEPHRVP